MKLVRLTIIALAILPGAAMGQDRPDQFGVLKGVAFDSLLGRPLAGAMLWLGGGARTAVTDSLGRFAFDSVTPGQVSLSLFHAELDEAGLPGLRGGTDVRGGDTTALVIAVPSFETFWRRICGSREIGADSGVVFGSVRDVNDGTRLVGVVVDAAWQSLARISPRQVIIRDQGMSARSDSTGSFALCGVATGVTVYAQARTGRVATGIIQGQVGPRRFVRRDFSLSRTTATDAGASLRSAAVIGAVRSERGHPLADALVSVAEDSGSTDRDGRFGLFHLPPGTQWLSVRAVGFSPLEQRVDLRRGDTLLLTLQLRELTVLDTVQVVGRAEVPRELEEFEHRRRLGLGYAFGEAEVRRYSSLRTLFQGVPSVTVQGQTVRQYVVLMWARNIEAGWCVANLFIDGIESDFEQLSFYDPEDIRGVEVYVRASTIPPRFQNLRNGCGAVLVWTRNLR